jgi:hypothetical protein
MAGGPLLFHILPLVARAVGFLLDFEWSRFNDIGIPHTRRRCGLNDDEGLLLIRVRGLLLQEQQTQSEKSHLFLFLSKNGGRVSRRLAQGENPYRAGRCRRLADRLQANFAVVKL